MSLSYGALAQSVTLKGKVQGSDGTPLPSAYLQIAGSKEVTTSNDNGSFSRKVQAGQVSLSVSFTGYETFQKTFTIKRDTTIRITLQSKASELEEVVVTSGRFLEEGLFESVKTSTNILSKDEISAIPVLGGEADAIKVLQLLPGTLRGVEGSSDLFVRGGAADQNLVLLDQVPVYNTSHLFGFLSVFSPDIIDKVESMNGGFSADYGGRLSSVLDIKTVSELADKTFVSGNIGTLASRLFVEQPLVKNKASFWVGGRRTYVDQVLKLLGEDLPYYFYDLNGKLILTPTKRDNIDVTYYTGRDDLDYFRDRDNDGSGITSSFISGNNALSMRWKHKLVSGWKSDLTLLSTAYRYTILNSFEENNLEAASSIRDRGAKLIFSRDSIQSNSYTAFGAEWTQHQISPNLVSTAGFFSEFIGSNTTPALTVQEVALHAQHEWDLYKKVRLNAGLRGSMVVTQGKLYAFPEPRLSARYALDSDNTFKASYSRMVQYMHRVSSSAVSSPTDIWYPVTARIAPQSSHKVALAWQRVMPRQRIFISVEGYYKSMNNLIGYEEGTNLFFNTDFESKLIQGKGRAYGVEVLVKKQQGKLTGWISYTLSWSRRQFDEINNGDWFYSRYDRRHNGAVVTQYALSKRFAVSAVWEFISGSRFTPVIGQYAVLSPSLTGIDLLPIYSKINDVKLSNSHRLDIGIKFKSRPQRRYQWEWSAGAYNVYNRANPVAISVVQDDADQSLKYQQPGLFGLIPYISYGFKF
jgi:hypothetical protein